MKLPLIILLVIVILRPASCIQNGQNGQNGQQEAVTDTISEPVDYNVPTFSHASTEYKYAYFGEADAHDFNPRLDESMMPPIPGLVYDSCFEYCKTDSCNVDRAIFALRCPEDKALLKWAAGQAEWFYRWCVTENYEADANQAGQFSSAKEIVADCIGRIDRTFKAKECRHDEAVPMQQFACLIADCWRTERWCTFYQATWYDWFSCGNNTTESYFSVDVETGQTATLADLVGAENLPRVAELLVDSLKNANGELWKDSRKDSKIDPMTLLEQRDGCALIREGLIIYYHPYTIGIGAEGSFSAIIPLDKFPFW